MSIPTPVEVAARLAELSRLLEAATTDADTLDEQAVRARQSYETAYARAFLTAEGAMDIRRYTAVTQTADVKLAAELADAQLRACRRRIDRIRIQIDLGRTLSATTRAEAALAGSGT